MVVVTYLASTIVLALTNNRNTANTLAFIIVMSFVAGSLAGALVMGGIYHGFSNLVQTRTAQHRADIHVLSERIANASTTIPSPPPASTRITHHPLTSLIQSKWNEEVAGLFGTAWRWEQRAVELGKKVLYGGDS